MAQGDELIEVFTWDLHPSAPVQFCPLDLWERVLNVSGWELIRARTEWPWYSNAGGLNRDLYFEFVYRTRSVYNLRPFECRVPYKGNPIDRDDHQGLENVTTKGTIQLWSERGDCTYGVIFVVLIPTDEFVAAVKGSLYVEQRPALV